MAATPKVAEKEKNATGEASKLRFPSWYHPNSSEVIERRRKLFAAINTGYTKEGEEAMDQLARESRDDDDGLE
jgi:hypothetical protein